MRTNKGVRTATRAAPCNSAMTKNLYPSSKMDAKPVPDYFLLGDVVDDKRRFYGIKTVVSRGRSRVRMRLKQCSQCCNVIEKDRLLRKE